jgi:hypothetical protein
MYLILQSDLSYVTLQGNIELGSHKTGGRFMQVYLVLNVLHREIKIKIT